MPNRRDEGCVTECRKRMSGRMIGVIVLGVVSLVIIIVAVVMHTLPTEDPIPFLQLHPSPGEGERPVAYVGDSDNWKQWAELLDDYLDGYTTPVEDGSHISSCYNLADGDLAPNGTACFFDIKTLGRCSYKGDKIFGFGAREPCFFLNPNKFDGWVPDYYKNIKELPEKVPKQLLDTMKEAADVDGKLPARLWISCEGKYEADTENMGTVEYLPHPYYKSYYFPYKTELLPYYRAPVVAVHFKAVPLGRSIHVICRAWAKNMEKMRPSVEWEMLFDA